MNHESPAVIKPPYRVPSMADIAAVEPCGLRVASTFSGCGGSSLGYRMAGFNVVWANEFVPAAQDSYRANMGEGTILDPRDIRTIKPEEVLAAIKMKVGELDLLDGSPPCASFSTAGKRSAGWDVVKKYSDTQQRTDDLFFEHARLLRGLQPKAFVAENVSGLVKGVAAGYFDDIHGVLEDCGYIVDARLLDAQWLGTPQMRQRIIFVGVRRDLAARHGVKPAHPRPLRHRYSVADACPWIVRADLITSGNERHTLAGRRPTHPADTTPAPTITATQAQISMLNVVESDSDMSRYATGEEWDNLRPDGTWSAKYKQLCRPDPNAPCPTVTAAGGNPGLASVAHPNEKRKFSIAELKRICGFPDDFVLTGSYAQQWERLGRAVPPTMMSRIAATVRDEVLMKLPR